MVPSQMMSSIDGSAWLKVFKPRPGAALRLFCFPYAGGGASVYRLWPDELPDWVEVCAVQLPGRESRWREEPFRRMDALADSATAALTPMLDRPFAFFGHSMGGALAFEVTRRLVAAPNGDRGDGARRVPLHLFVSGRPAPGALDDKESIHELPRDEFIEAIRGYSGTPEEVLQNRELMELVEPLLRADFAVSETYRPASEREPLEVPVTALGGVGDEDVSEEQLEAWRDETRGPFHKQMFDGGHFFLTERAAEVLAVVRRELTRLPVGAA
jgi:surfactin synthase thioesterase subunit